DPGDVHALVRLRHRAAHDHIVDVARVDAGCALQRLGDGNGAQLVGPRAAQSAGRRLARCGPHRGNDHSFMHTVLKVRLKPDTTYLSPDTTYLSPDTTYLSPCRHYRYPVAPRSQSVWR